MKLICDGLAVSTGAVTFSVTGMLAGLAPAELIVTVPLYVPALKPLVLIAMLTGDGTVPLGVAESQAAVPVEVVKAIPDVPVTLTDCAAGGVPPSVKLNVRGVEGTVNVVPETL